MQVAEGSLSLSLAFSLWYLYYTKKFMFRQTALPDGSCKMGVGIYQTSSFTNFKILAIDLSFHTTH